MGCGCSASSSDHALNHGGRPFLHGYDEKDFLHSLTVHELKDKKLLLAYFHLLKSSSVEGQFDLTDQLISLVRKKGLPQRFRWLVWKAITGWSALYKPGAYERILVLEPDRKVSEAIEKDLDRTFPAMEAFDDHKKRALRKMLRAYAALFPSVGYVQGMNFVAGFLLLAAGEHVDAPQDAFFMFVQIMVKYRASLLFCEGLPLLKLHTFQYQGLLEKVFPEVHTHLDANFVTPEMYVTKWILTMFTQSLPFSVTARIWDIIVCDGLEFVVLAALGTVKVLRSRIVKLDTEGILELMTWQGEGEDGAPSGEAIVKEAMNLQLPKFDGVDFADFEDGGAKSKHASSAPMHARIADGPPSQPILPDDIGIGVGAMMPGSVMQKSRCADAMAALQKKWVTTCAIEAESLQGAAMQLSAHRVDQGTLARLLPGGDFEDLSPPATDRQTGLQTPTVVEAQVSQPGTARSGRSVLADPLSPNRLSMGEQLRRTNIQPISHAAAVAAMSRQAGNTSNSTGSGEDQFSWNTAAYAEASGNASFDVDMKGMVTVQGPGGAFRGTGAQVAVGVGYRHQNPHYDVNFDDVDEGNFDLSTAMPRQLSKMRLKSLRGSIGYGVERHAPKSMGMLNFDYTNLGGGEVALRPRPSSASGVGGERKNGGQAIPDGGGQAIPYDTASQPVDYPGPDFHHQHSAMEMAPALRHGQRFHRMGTQSPANQRSYRPKLAQGPMPTDNQRPMSIDSMAQGRLPTDSHRRSVDSASMLRDLASMPRDAMGHDRAWMDSRAGAFPVESPRPQSAGRRPPNTGGSLVPQSAREKPRTTSPFMSNTAASRSHSGPWASNTNGSFQMTGNGSFRRTWEDDRDTAGTWEDDLGMLEEGGWGGSAKQSSQYNAGGSAGRTAFTREAWQTPRAASTSRTFVT